MSIKYLKRSIDKYFKIKNRIQMVSMLSKLKDRMKKLRDKKSSRLEDLRSVVLEVRAFNREHQSGNKSLKR